MGKVIGISRWRWVYLAWKTGEIMTLSDWYIMYVYAVGQDGVWREIRYLSTSGSTSLFRKQVEMVLQACKRLVLAIS